MHCSSLTLSQCLKRVKFKEHWNYYVILYMYLRNKYFVILKIIFFTHTKTKCLYSLPNPNLANIAHYIDLWFSLDSYAIVPCLVTFHHHVVSIFSANDIPLSTHNRQNYNCLFHTI